MSRLWIRERKKEASMMPYACFALLLLFAPRLVLAAAGDLDPTFGVGGVAANPAVSWVDEINYVADAVSLASGKTISAAQVQITDAFGGNQSQVALSRWLADGAPDFSFGSSGTVLLEPFIPLLDDPTEANDEALQIAAQADGKLLVLGISDGLPSGAATVLSRRQPYGNLDTTFGIAGTVVVGQPGVGLFYAGHLLQQRDGMLVLAGTMQNASSADFALQRLDADGNPDESFGSAGLVVTPVGSPADYDAFIAVVEQADGKLVAVGYSQGADLTLARYLVSGALDSSFGSGGISAVSSGVTFFPIAVGIQADDKVVVLRFDNVQLDEIAVQRFDTAGALDASFGTGGTAIISYGAGVHSAAALAVLASGQSLIAGSFDAPLALSRLDATGALDASFGMGGTVFTPSGYPAALLPQCNGSTIAAGSAHLGQIVGTFLARYRGDTSCGDAVIDAGEACDDGNVIGTDACKCDCSENVCGDGVVHAGIEQCDDGNPSGGDGCENDCRLTPKSVSGTVSAGGYITSDVENDGATPADPVEVLVLSPVAGSVSIDRTPTGGTPGVGYELLTGQVQITAPTATVDAPLLLAFRIDASLIPPDQNETSIQIMRNGAPVPPCIHPFASADAIPNPCVTARSRLADGDVQLVVFTATASDWNLNLATCTAQPAPGCQPAAAGTGKLLLKRGPTAEKDALVCKWTSSADTPVGQFGDPTIATDYTLCAYDGTGLLATAVIPAAGTCAGVPCWSVQGDGFKYADHDLATGVKLIKLKPGAAGAAKIIVKAKGANLGGLRSFPLSAPVTMQLRATSGACWETTVSTPAASDEKKFKGKSL
jgi:uncharacterized delta-60 repeat protein